MEDLFAYMLIAGMLAFFVLFTVTVVKFIKRQRDKSKEASQKLWESMQTETASQRREYALAKDRASRLNLNPPPAPTRSYASSNTTSTSSTTTTSSSDSLLTDLATMYVLNSALNHGSAKADVDYETKSVKISTPSSSSWGLDDDDSRKSSSSTFSSSDSSSSWDSSSSSSDSGPSSDW